MYVDAAVHQSGDAEARDDSQSAVGQGVPAADRHVRRGVGTVARCRRLGRRQDLWVVHCTAGVETHADAALAGKHKRVKWVPFRHGGLSDETFKLFVTRIAAKLRAMQRAQ